jgi:anthranilate phosphoribosyltransferase
MVDKMVQTLARLGSRHVVAFHGDGGLDELSISGPSQVTELKGGEIHRWVLDPGDLGIEPAPAGAVAGGSAEENAKLVRDVLGGQPGPRRDIVALNAAAGLLAADKSEDVGSGLQLAYQAIDSGAANEALDRFIACSNELGS